MIFAHRGFYDKYIPENSIEAFKKCIVRNIPFELDVRKTKDDKLVVFHDKDLLRMTGVNEFVENTTYEKIKTLKLNKSKEHIPLLSEVLNLNSDRVDILIEIKSKNIEKLVYDETKKYKKILFQSFDKKTVKNMKKITDKKVGFLTWGFKEYKKCDFISVNAENAFRFKDKDLILWTINSKEELEKLSKYKNFIVNIKNVLK